MNGRDAIYVDFDDILCETARDLTRLLEEEFGKRVAYEAITQFSLNVSFGMSEDEHARFMDLAHRDENILRLAPVAGAREVLGSWRERGTEVRIVTGRPPHTREASLEWLARHAMPFSEIVFVDKYGRFERDEGTITLDALKRMEFLLAVEDAPPQLEWLHANTSVPLVVLERPWNRDAPKDPDPGRPVMRCPDWKAVREAAEPFFRNNGKVI